MRGFGKRQPSVVSQVVPSPYSGFAVTSGARDMDSTPPATKSSPSPARIACAAPTTAESPDAQRRFTVTPATLCGKPREQRAHARDVAVVLPGLVGGAEVDVLYLCRRDACPLHGLLDDESGEVVRPHVRERASVAPDGRPDRGKDDCLSHEASLPAA